MSAVTDTRIRRITCCAICDGLFDTRRSDAVTCSPACRTRGHRTGELKRLAALFAGMGGNDITVSMVMQARARRLLLPARNEQILAGTLQPDSPELLAEMDAAFCAIERGCMQLAIDRAQGAHAAAESQP
ncbi:hypothetical protein [Metallibacterium scheffleri]|uniref:Uncharacterized protein n=1 Tax=Metallibacterium scheffleri TaxID=993689 RepID=A0A4S3KLG5_9GAMM|nr:hypothetical protein [Metallibacterium scheffleri]THD09693.1 hypothetical protein B1806_10190 [Metallibacterium scheffleri]